MDPSENYVRSLTGRIVAGQVVGDSKSKIPMSAQLSMHLEDLYRTPRRGDLLRIRREVLTPFGWYGPPLFTGPVDRSTLEDRTLNVDLLDKSSLLREPTRSTHIYRKGLTRIGVIRDVAYDRGERRFDLPEWNQARLGAPVQVRPGYQPWSYMVVQARALRGQVFYNGAGALRVRQHPTGTSLWFNDDSVLSVPSVVEDDADIINSVHVKGKPPAGKKWRIEAKAYIPAWHRLSPQKLARSGVRQHRWETIEDETIRTVRDAQAAADRRVRELMAQTGGVTFTALPHPGIELGDVQQVNAAGVVTPYRLSSFTIPLTADEPMTVGYIKPLRRSKKR
ncbi:hypothetical protein [Janibacter sp. GS2]|uniref:hypothetical protein n=1 Tax=Janibacter sp. GS2 TaxID=3442646 RepID=UPI003EB8AD87